MSARLFSLLPWWTLSVWSISSLCAVSASERPTTESTQAPKAAPARTLQQVAVERDKVCAGRERLSIEAVRQICIDINKVEGVQWKCNYYSYSAEWEIAQFFQNCRTGGHPNYETFSVGGSHIVSGSCTRDPIGLDMPTSYELVKLCRHLNLGSVGSCKFVFYQLFPSQDYTFQFRHDCSRTDTRAGSTSELFELEPTPSPTSNPTPHPTPRPAKAPTLSPTPRPTASPTPLSISEPSPTLEPTSSTSVVGTMIIAAGVLVAIILLGFLIRRCYKKKVSKITENSRNVEGVDNWDELKRKWGFLGKYDQHYSDEQRAALRAYLPNPENWSLSWQALLKIEALAVEEFGDEYATKSMWDVVQRIVKPVCKKYGAPIALVHNGWKVAKVDGFVTHCWTEPFAEFMNSLRAAYDTDFIKPNLFICAFTIFQGDFDDVSGALGENIEDAPFVKSLRTASHFLVVRNSAVDLYKRGWCLIEFLYARKYGLYPENVRVTGPHTFATSTSSVMDADASVKTDRVKILKAIMKEGDIQTVDEQIAGFRAFQLDSTGEAPFV